MKSVLVMLLIAAAASLAAGQTPEKKTEAGGAPQDAVVKLAKDWIEAEDRRDGAALDRLLAEDFVGTAPSGEKVTKKMVVPDPQGRGGGLSFTGDDFVARVYGEMAVVTGNGTWKAREQGTLCFTLVFVKRQGRWQMVSAHVSNVPEG